MSHAAPGDHLVGQSPHLLSAPREHHDLHAPVVIRSMCRVVRDKSRPSCDVSMRRLVELARGGIVDIDHRSDAAVRSPSHIERSLLDRRSCQVPDGFRPVRVTPSSDGVIGSSRPCSFLSARSTTLGFARLLFPGRGKGFSMIFQTFKSHFAIAHDIVGFKKTYRERMPRSTRDGLGHRSRRAALITALQRATSSSSAPIGASQDRRPIPSDRDR